MMRKYIIILFSSLILGIVGVANAAPSVTIVPNLKITGLPSRDCLGTDNTGLVQSGTCSGGGGSGSVSTSTPITASTFPFWQTTGGALNGSSSIFYSAGNIGINTSAASTSLHVVGTFRTSASSTFDSLIASRAVITDAGQSLASSPTTATEIGYVSGVTSAIQTQLNGKQASGSYALQSTTISAGGLLTGGGDLSTNRTISFASSSLGLGTLSIINSPVPIINGGTATTTTPGDAQFLVGQNSGYRLLTGSAGTGLTFATTTTGFSYALSTPVSVANGGTATTTTPQDLQVLVGDNTTYKLRKLTAGSNVTITTSTTAITIAASSGSGCTVPGSNTDVIYNNGGACGADAGLTYVSSTQNLTVGGIVNASEFDIGSVSITGIGGIQINTGAGSSFVLNNFSGTAIQLLANGNTVGALLDPSGISSTDKTFTLPNLSGTVLLGTGTSGQLSYFNNTNRVTSSSTLTFDTTNARLGILTAAPSSTLHIIGTFRASATSTFDTGSMLSNVANGATAIAYKLDTSNSLSTSGAKVASFRNAGVEELFIDKDGNIDMLGAKYIQFNDSNNRLYQSGSSMILTSAASSYFGGRISIAGNSGGTGGVTFDRSDGAAVIASVGAGGGFGFDNANPAAVADTYISKSTNGGGNLSTFFDGNETMRIGKGFSIATSTIIGDVISGVASTTLHVVGTGKFTGALFSSSTLDVSGAVILGSTLQSGNNNTLGTMTISGALKASSTVDFSGAIISGSTLQIGGATTLLAALTGTTATFSGAVKASSTIEATGKIQFSSASGTSLMLGPSLVTATTTKAFHVMNPTATMKEPFFQTPAAMTVGRILCVNNNDAGNTVTFNVKYGSTTAGTSQLFATDKACTNTATSTVYTAADFASSTPALGDIMRFTTSAASSTGATFQVELSQP